MRIPTLAKIATKNLWSYRVRSALTISGVVIGVGSIIFLVSLGYGLENLVTTQVADFSAFAVLDAPNASIANTRADQTLVDKITAIDNVEAVGISTSTAGKLRLSKNNSTAETVVVASNTEYWDITQMKPQVGQLPLEPNTVLLNRSALNIMQEEESLIGQSVLLDVTIPADFKNKIEEGASVVEGLPLSVVGIIDDLPNPVVYVNLDLLSTHQATRFSSLKIKVKDRDKIDTTRTEIDQLGLTTEYIGDTVQEIEQIFTLFRFMLAAFGLIALVVASLGTFNTLTISLLERTREVGLFKALGMPNRDIYRLFLFEALLIGAFGGMLGWVVGGSIATGANFLVKYLAVKSGAEAISLFYTPWVFGLAIAILSIIVGFLTGWYPARRAVKINPLDALRYE